MRLALMAGAYRAARNLSAEGAAQYPDDAELQKAARILAPPKVRRSNLPSDPSIQADHEWLQTHAAEYRGQWIALRQGQLLGAAQSLAELVKLVGDLKNVLVAPIY